MMTVESLEYNCQPNIKPFDGKKNWLLECLHQMFTNLIFRRLRSKELSGGCQFQCTFSSTGDDVKGRPSKKMEAVPMDGAFSEI